MSGPSASSSNTRKRKHEEESEAKKTVIPEKFKSQSAHHDLCLVVESQNLWVPKALVMESPVLVAQIVDNKIQLPGKTLGEVLIFLHWFTKGEKEEGKNYRDDDSPDELRRIAIEDAPNLARLAQEWQIDTLQADCDNVKDYYENVEDDYEDLFEGAESDESGEENDDYYSLSDRGESMRCLLMGGHMNLDAADIQLLIWDLKEDGVTLETVRNIPEVPRHFKRRIIQGWNNPRPGSSAANPAMFSLTALLNMAGNH